MTAVQRRYRQHVENGKVDTDQRNKKQKIQGTLFGLLAFVCVAMGGFGSIPGALLAALLIGLVESLCGFYIAPVFKYVAVFGLYLVVVMFRPKGFFGW